MWRKLFLLLLSAAFLHGCKFNVSPYVSHTPNIKLNQKQLALIKAKEAGASDNFNVAVLSDTHNHYEELDKQIKYINKRKNEYEFVIITGDLTNLGLLREFETVKRFLEKLAVPFLTVVGNHDLLSNGESIYMQMFGAFDYAFTYKQTKFILFNNNNWESSGKIPDLDFLEDEMANSTSTNLILAAHVSQSDEARWSLGEMSSVKALSDAYGVDYILNGHDHNPGDGFFGNAVRVTVGSPNKGKILELNMSNAGVTHQFVRF